MLQIRGRYEVAIPVRQLQRAEAFYRDVLGLAVGLRDERRKWLFLRAGGAAGMVVLQEHDGEFPIYHFAFTVDRSDLERAAIVLRECGCLQAAQPSTTGYRARPSTSRIPTAMSWSSSRFQRK